MKAIAVYAMLTAGCLWMSPLGAATYLQGKIIMDKDYDINITILRWGTVDPRTTDKIIGQLASLDYKEATLVFDVCSPTTNKPAFQRLTITAKTEIYGRGDNGGYCVYCLKGHRTGGRSAFSRGATVSGGCYFGFTFPRVKDAVKLRLVNVLVDGRPVKYMTTFNTAGEIPRNPLAVPVPTDTSVHQPEFTFEMPADTQVDVVKESTTTVEGKVAQPPPSPKGITFPNIVLTVDQNDPVELAAAKKIYEEQLHIIEATYRAELDRSSASYTSNIAALENRLQTDADLDGLVAVKGERGRYGQAHEIPDVALSTHPALKAAQLKCQAMLKEAKNKEETSVSRLGQAYILRLNAVKANYTKAGNVDDALVVNAEIRRVTALSAVESEGLVPVSEAAKKEVQLDTQDAKSKSTVLKGQKDTKVPANRAELINWLIGTKWSWGAGAREWVTFVDESKVNCSWVGIVNYTIDDNMMVRFATRNSVSHMQFATDFRSFKTAEGDDHPRSGRLLDERDSAEGQH